MSRRCLSGRNWFFEDTEKLGEPSAACWGMLPEEEIYAGKSAFQEIEIFRVDGYGKVLVLDGLVQLSTDHEFIYHEMLVHPAAFYHGNPKKVMIIGGGDGGTLREILKHPVEEVLLVDIDEEVIRISREHLPMVSQGSFEDGRVRLIHDDALRVIDEYPGTFDLIISDSTDSYGPSEALWQREFYCKVHDALKQDGVAGFQAGYFKEGFARKGRSMIREVFPFTAVHRAYVGCFPLDECAFMFASKTVDMKRSSSLSKVSENYVQIGLKTSHYSPEIHFASRVLPEHMREREG